MTRPRFYGRDVLATQLERDKLKERVEFLEAARAVTKRKHAELVVWCREVVDEARDMNISELFQPTTGKGDLVKRGEDLLKTFEDQA